jgi:hypothetical protein
MIDITSSTDESGNVKHSAAIVSGTFAEIDAALLAQKTVLVIGRYPTTNPVSYQYFRCGEHRPAAEIVFTSTGGGEWFRGVVIAATWYPAANGEPERVLVDDASGILSLSPMGDGNAVTSIEKNTLFPIAVVKKDKTFVDTAEQSLTEEQKAQARTNIGAGTYSKPANGIPASDLAQGVIPTVPTEVFIVTYGTTTQAEIKAAVAAGQLPICKYGDNLYVYAGGSSADYSQFTSVLHDTAYRIYVKNSTWGSGSYEVYSKPNGGIPASDLADGVIPDVSNFITKSVNDLVNYYLKSEVYTKEEVAALIGAIQQFHYEIAASTSAVSDPQSNVLYLIGPSGTGSDKYEEYVYSNGWVKIGDTSIDLSGYVTGLNKGDGDNVLGESTSFTTAPSAVSFAAHTTETFVKSVNAETNKKLVTTTVPNVTSVGSASTWNFSMGTGTDAETLIVSGGNGTAPTLGTAKTVATGATDANGTGSPIVTGVTVGSSAAAITALGAATAAAQTITVGTNDKVKVAKYDDLSVNKN